MKGFIKASLITSGRRRLKTHIRHITSISLLFASLAGSGGAWAVDCRQSHYRFSSQAQVDAFPQYCDSVVQIRVDNRDITNLDGLANLTSVGGKLSIIYNDALTNLDGLANLTSVGSLEIYNNDALTNLDGLANLTSVGASFYISKNDALTNLDGLANLTSVGRYPTPLGFYIASNNALTNCQGIAPVLGWPGGTPDYSVAGDIAISRNATGCNSVDEILASVTGPSQPVINTATGGNERISLAFSLSTTLDDLFPILGYEAVCTGLTEIETAQGVGSPLSVGNLTNYRDYDCTVAPVTRLGALPLSSSVSATPTPVTEAPSAPHITDIEPGNAQISISVSSADEGGSPITLYIAVCAGSSGYSLGTSPTSPIIVSGLTNGVSYVCAVIAENYVGSSPLSAVSEPVTPLAPPPGC